jgi:lipopolysaccharide transport system ATP-binding protein
VSHDLNAVSRLTDKCLLLDKGKLIEAGPTPTVIKTYYQRKEQNKNDYYNQTDTGKPRIVSIVSKTSEPGKVQVHNKELLIEFTVSVPEGINNLSLSFQVMNQQMQPVLHFWTPAGMREPGIYKLSCMIPAIHLYMGSYSLSTYLGEDKGKEVYESLQDLAPFEVVMTGIDPGHSFGWQEGSSVYREQHEWKIDKIH